MSKGFPSFGKTNSIGGDGELEYKEDMNEETPTPSRRRGRPPKVILAPISEPEPILAPPQEPVSHVALAAQAVSVQPESRPQEAVPSPLPKLEPPLEPVKADDVDLRENPDMAARHTISGSDSKVRGASDSYLPVEAGKAIPPNPALPEQSNGATGTSVEAGGQRQHFSGPSILPTGASPVESQVQTSIPTQRPTPERMPDSSPAESILAAPVQFQQPSWTPVQLGDVVQINSHRNKHLGALFIVGDIKHHRVHGYQIGTGGKLEYFTVNEDECIVVGSMTRGQIRARKGCSPKWVADNR